MTRASEPSRASVIRTEKAGEGYYAWHASHVAIRGDTLIVMMKPGMIGHGQLDMAAVLLAENITAEPGDVVVDIQCGGGLAGAVAAGQVGEGHVYLVDSNLVPYQAASKTINANGLQNASAALSRGISTLNLISDLAAVTLRIPKNKSLGRQMIWDAF